MKDERYVFQQEVRERKDLARQSRYKKNGSKSKKCTLPSDYMTRKEKLAMNGEVVSYNFKHFYTYEEFKTLPDHAKVEYLNNLSKKYKVSIRYIARVVLCVSDKTLDSHLRTRGLIGQIKSHGHGTNADREYLETKVKMIREANQSEPVFPQPEPMLVGTIPALIPGDNRPREYFLDEDGNVRQEIKKNNPDSFIRHASFDLEGFDDDFFEFLKRTFDGKKLRISVSVDVMD